jgi:hypothetical protein
LNIGSTRVDVTAVQQRKEEVWFIMAKHRAGRPAKPDQEKRQQLHISLYAEDIARLDRLTDNRSEFLRQCIAKAWEERTREEATRSIALPESLVRELRKLVEQLEPHHQVATYQTLAARLKE